MSTYDTTKRVLVNRRSRPGSRTALPCLRSRQNKLRKRYNNPQDSRRKRKKTKKRANAPGALTGSRYVGTATALPLNSCRPYEEGLQTLGKPFNVSGRHQRQIYADKSAGHILAQTVCVVSRLVPGTWQRQSA